ncbi:YlqD family protein [Selenomonas ruminantium]|uniref:YlqD protein n=1 Tax=Selenomonas ruminantium TaxID=971 RepID=A0A1H0Q8I0_SELRU|nr:YlqD family protein [Selenomonas ruminantium]SDP13683.1 YlqD protein [Selenomonas ruminantium]
MDSISLKVPVTIKAKLTEKLKNKILTDLTEGINRAELEVQQLNIQEKRVMQENQPADAEAPTAEEIQRLQAIQAHFGEERNKRLQFREESLARKEEMEKMVLGAEIVQGTLEHQVEVHVGDDMREIMNVEVLVEDDKVIAIRS